MKKQLTEKMFNVKNIKKCLQIGVLVAALVFAAMGFAGCQHDSAEEPKEEPEVEYCNEDGCEKKGEALPHSHDYCEVDGCTDKHTDTNGIHYAEWVDFKDFGNGFKVPFMKDDEYLEQTNYDPINNMNEYQNEYQTFIKGLTFSEAFTNKFSELPFSVSENSTDKYNVDIEFKTFTTYNDSENFKINANENFDYLIKNINDVCVPVFEEMTKYVGISLDDNNTGNDNLGLDKNRFSNYIWATGLEAYKAGCSQNFDGMGKEYYDLQKNGSDYYYGITSTWESMHGGDTPFDLYITENGEEVLNPKVAEQMDLMLERAAGKMGVEVQDLKNIVNLSLVMQSMDAVHDYMSASLTHNNSDTCQDLNNVVNTIDDVEVGEMAYIQNNNKGIELC